MPSISSWLLAARLRTLPLSISGILVGSGLAQMEGLFKWEIFVLALLSTLGFQVLSNFANDYGDGVKGTDNEHRVGPARAMQSGLLTTSDLIRGMIVITVLTMMAVIALIYTAFGADDLMLSLLFLFLGITAIIAAVKYTVGKSAYGYRGLGDFFVFIFFGLVAVMGSYFLFTRQLDIVKVLPAATIGLLATAVLHLNNMRDRVEDEKVGKKTLAVLMGKSGSKRYHIVVIMVAFVAWNVFLFVSKVPEVYFLTILPFLVLGIHIRKVILVEQPKAYDPELKKVALVTFTIASVFFVLCLILPQLVIG
ncbi:1,4-dihydroxy-2-naphthoate octaprenyltransferase [Dokdonia sinensis]|uniref:1,4-dihydroxy-2-naphthoate octaprenyltransferase n=1 Tax=Dokdonia sinensis TaxID=2479847 RepID=A0A3M0GHC3_9FLAO|nr:1,4-dihydroxy-2-naphthoate octaprenyltransferase [Dokdonia sinensis]RMB63967.1 1,4-dihydroxy-2-naphthoate octaprenyltransferase [Dokdonia sinensis]